MTKDNTFYFSHDYNAMSDEKIKNLLCEHGLNGYGAFWAIVEMLYNNANALRTNYKSIAFDLHSNEKFIKSVINDFGLFIIDGDNFGSESVERRLNERNEKSISAKKSADLRWKKHRENANALPTQSDSNAIKESKVKEIKEKKTKLNEYKNILLSEICISDFPQLKSDYFDIAKSFQELFSKNVIDAGAKPTIIEKAKGTWIDDIRMLIEIDGYSIIDLREVYTFLQNDSFWKCNILSTSKLRQQIAKLKLNIKNGNDTANNQANRGNGKPTYRNDAEERRAGVERLKQLSIAILQQPNPEANQ